MEKNIYYSQLRIQQSGFGDMPPTDHVLNLKVLSLLSNRILIPAVHLLNASRTEILKSMGEEMQCFFDNDRIYCQLPRNVSSLDEYLGNKKEQTTAMMKRERIRSNAEPMNKLLGNVNAFREFDGVAQSLDFCDLMKDIISDMELSTGVQKKLHTFIDKGGSCGNQPLKQEEFVLNVGDSLKGTNKNQINLIKKNAEVAYFIVGSNSNNRLVSTNSFLDSNSLALLNKHVANELHTSFFYNPEVFLEILKAIGIISSSDDIKQLTFNDIERIRNERCFTEFLKWYNNINRTMKDLEEFKKQRGGCVKVMNVIKTCSIELGIGIGTASLLYPQVDSLGFTILGVVIALLIGWWAQYTSKGKLLKAETVGELIDNIAYKIDPFSTFCSKLQYVVDRHR